MKKSFTLLLVLILVSVFSLLILFTIEVKSLKSTNNTKAYLYLQAKLHMQFLESIAKDMTKENNQTLFLQKDNFKFEIHLLEKSIELFVISQSDEIRLHKSLTR